MNLRTGKIVLNPNLKLLSEEEVIEGLYDLMEAVDFNSEEHEKGCEDADAYWDTINEK